MLFESRLFRKLLKANSNRIFRNPANKMYICVHLFPSTTAVQVDGVVFNKKKGWIFQWDVTVPLQAHSRRGSRKGSSWNIMAFCCRFLSNMAFMCVLCIYSRTLVISSSVHTYLMLFLCAAAILMIVSTIVVYLRHSSPFPLCAFTFFLNFTSCFI